MAPGARFCANCGAEIGGRRSNVWPMVLAALIAR
jgi:hypothetical protein